MDLVIDDERIRKNALYDLGLNPDHEWVETSREALLLVKVGTLSRFDRIWFDHDLRDMDTTMIVAQWFAEAVFHGVFDPDDIPLCIIHTMNPVGRINLKAVFDRWGIHNKEVFL